MSVWAISMVRDEEDIIRATVGNMLDQVDRVLIADNLSRDATRTTLDSMARRWPDRLTVVDDPDPGYYQSKKMTALARRACCEGATWVVPFDADEYWVGSLGTVAETLVAHEADFGLVTAQLFDHMATGRDPQTGDLLYRLPWRRTDPLPLPKVAVRAHPAMVIEQGNHWARLPVPPAATPTPRLTVHHYPYRSLEQFIHKVRNGADAYAATDLPDNVGAHWRKWGEMTDDQLSEVFHTWYYREHPDQPITIGDDQLPPLIRDPPVR